MKPSSSGFTGECYQTCKKKIIAILYRLFQKVEADGILPNSFYENSINLISKLEKTLQ